MRCSAHEKRTDYDVWRQRTWEAGRRAAQRVRVESGVGRQLTGGVTGAVGINSSWDSLKPADTFYADLEGKRVIGNPVTECQRRRQMVQTYYSRCTSQALYVIVH